MKPLPTPQEMSAADERAIEAGTPGFVLMDRAGRAVARAVIRVMGGRYGKRVSIVCGKGNNGGDGFVAGRALALEGMLVRCHFVGDAGSLKGDAARHRDLFLRAGGRLDTFDPRQLRDADVIVDALFGTGFSGPAEGEAGRAIESINDHPAPVVAVDIPSGVDGLSGAVGGPAVMADVTVAIAAQKVGSALGAGAEHAGDVVVADIGIPAGTTRACIMDDVDVAHALPVRSAGAHKRSAGSVALLTGSEGMSGAAILAARGAVRMGAGYATVGVPRSIEPVVAAVLPEVLTRIVTDEAYLSPDALTAFKSVLDRSNAVAIGPGLGEGENQQRLVHAVLAEVSQPVVVDADGLNVLAPDPSVLSDRAAATVLTPHPAELARLLQSDTATVQADRAAAARAAADRFGAVVLLKGYRTVIARPDGNIVVNATGTSHLATAGTGDVLTGAVAALLAAGLEPFEAAWAAAHVHGIAGEVAASKRDGRGVLAWDVAESLPEAIAVVKEVAWD